MSSFWCNVSHHAFYAGIYSFISDSLLTGIGMGGALPIVITMVSEAVPDKYKATAVSSMYCGMPIGGF